MATLISDHEQTHQTEMYKNRRKKHVRTHLHYLMKGTIFSMFYGWWPFSFIPSCLFLYLMIKMRCAKRTKKKSTLSFLISMNIKRSLLDKVIKMKTLYVPYSMWMDFFTFRLQLCSIWKLFISMNVISHSIAQHNQTTPKKKKKLIQKKLKL